MSKLNKPRASEMPDAEAARAFLAEQRIELLEVTEVIHFSEGSMSILMMRGEALWATVIEHDPDYAAKIALAFKSVGIPVERRDG